jgi:hypothetical protein
MFSLQKVHVGHPVQRIIITSTKFKTQKYHQDITARSLKHKNTNYYTVMPDDGSLNRNMWLWMTNIKVLFLAAILHWYAV